MSNLALAVPVTNTWRYAAAPRMNTSANNCGAISEASIGLGVYAGVVCAGCSIVDEVPSAPLPAARVRTAGRRAGTVDARPPTRGADIGYATTDPVETPIARIVAIVASEAPRASNLWWPLVYP